MYPLGKLPPTPVRFQFGDYLLTNAAPRRPAPPTPPKKRPATFGRESLISTWGKLGNDKYGDCVLAAAAHETMLWNREAGAVVPFTEKSVLSDYSATTGFDPKRPAETDQGASMADVAYYRRKTGVLDGKGRRHKIVAYLGLIPGHVPELLQACWLFGAVGVGLFLPKSAGEQFDRGVPWSLPMTSFAGRHCVSVVARRKGLIWCVTWGRLQAMTDEFYQANNDESLAYVSYERLTYGLSLDGFDAATLLADLWKLDQAA